jgi:Mrp family chromosome partitioning ATPase
MGGTGSVVVTSPEPGAGRTSVCLGLGGALVGTGHRAAVVDCNLENPQLHRMLGQPNFVGLTSGLQGDKTLEHYGREAVPGLLAVPTGPVPPDIAARLETERFVEAVRGKVLESPTLSRGFGGILLVVHASRTSKGAAHQTTDDLLEAGADLLGVVLNGWS